MQLLFAKIYTVVLFFPCLCSYESACEEYLKALDLLRSSEEPDIGPVQKGYISNFIVNRVWWNGLYML